jgi:hypothetical protein
VNCQLFFLSNPRDKAHIKGEEKLCANVYGRGEDMCVFLSGDRCCGFPLRGTRHRRNHKWDSEDLLAIAGQRLS